LRAVGPIAVSEIQILRTIVGTGDRRLQVNDFSEHAPPEDLTGALALWIVGLAQEVFTRHRASALPTNMGASITSTMARVNTARSPPAVVTSEI
jgi:hypothetical protein